MEQTDTQALNRKLAEWVGFRKVDHPTAWVECAYNYPDGNLYSFKEFPNFTNSLDACFKWIVPKWISIRMQRENYSQELTAWRELFQGWLEQGTDALALCSAIEKVIDDR